MERCSKCGAMPVGRRCRHDGRRFQGVVCKHRVDNCPCHGWAPDGFRVVLKEVPPPSAPDAEPPPPAPSSEPPKATEELIELELERPSYDDSDWVRE